MSANWRCSCVLQVCFFELIHFAITVAYLAMKHGSTISQFCIPNWNINFALGMYPCVPITNRVNTKYKVNEP